VPSASRQPAPRPTGPSTADRPRRIRFNMTPRIGTDMDTTDLFTALDFIWRFNDRAKRADVVWIWTGPGRTWLAMIGPNARHMSNALYHILRGMGRRRVRRWRGRRMWYVAYS